MKKILLLINICLIFIFCSCSEVTKPEMITTDPVEMKTFRENISIELEYLGKEAIDYYRTPRAVGGGSNSFNYWGIPDSLKESQFGLYNYELINKDELKLIGEGKIIGNDGVNPIRLEAMVYTSYKIEIVIIN